MKTPFELYEKVHFYFKQNVCLQDMLESSNHKQAADLIEDIALLIEGDHTSNRYLKAFERGIKHYQRFTENDLFEYYRYLAKTFNLTAMTCRKIRIKKSKIPSNIS